MEHDTKDMGSRQRTALPAPLKPICVHRSADELASERESARLQALAVDEIAVLLRAEYVPAWRLLLPLHGAMVTKPGSLDTIEAIYQHLARELVDRHLVQDGRYRATATRAQLTALYVAMDQRFTPEQTGMVL